MLLDDGAEANAEGGLFLKFAVNSRTDSAMKLRCLSGRGADGKYTDAQGFSVLHMAAQSATATKDVLLACTDPEFLNLKADLTDNKGNTPLHIAAMSEHDNSDMITCTLANKCANASATNGKGETPLSLVLRDKRSSKDLRRSKVGYLLENVVSPKTKISKIITVMLGT